ncbi:MAG: glucosamine-6-phosphate deaminase [Ruminococcaceae bacterium]|nr:glucosamine-6-phosphate deaminase [Oscillospiraceae bacterium]
MKILVVDNYAEMSRAAADIFGEVIKENPTCVLGLATGDTPIGLYDCLIDDYKTGKLDFAGVRTVNLDEYYPISPDNDQSYRYFMNEKLFDSINIDKKNTMVPDGLAKDANKFCREYEEMIDSLGGIDVQVLGVGRNGHVGFNEPEDGLYPYTHLTDLTANTIEANSRFFASEADVPKQALTMGMSSIFKARKIVVMASGKGKAEAVKTMLGGRITTSCPATLLALHNDVVLICDKDAYSLV